jgi:ABC-type transporter Mla MlaB component
MWMIQVVEEGGFVVFRLSGRLEKEQLIELQNVLESKAHRRDLAMDLRDVKLVDSDAVGFLARRERSGAEIRNCPAYIREWITKENEGK